ncbi:hypothetical protein [Chamaesiphon minutus]|uniref:Uncharacterized protein n=1 Tax=Chamaesiphon minutus (strain ATCC 27169 / PCC 6605) TaxID=1173020 RepID=K9UBV8_CHAP6|nr:hypothetical protein [Chamaesiphon minutus]AFY92602.1 hypothetical protein Cha6605_1425 [Chamaesiphon minutus PCC 6605]
MPEPITTMTASTIATLAFQEFVKSGAGELSKKFTAEAIAKMGQLRSEFVARMLTVSSSLKAQGRSVLDFLTQSCQASRLGTTPPTLIPMSDPTFSNERIILL